MLALIRRYRELILVAALLLVPLGVYVAHAKAPVEPGTEEVTAVVTATFAIS